MIDDPQCPVCESTDWDVLGAQTWSREDSLQSEYVRTRYDILFSDWCPDRTSLTTSYVLCADCGMVIYTPRPTADEVATKYRRLGGATSSTVHAPTVTRIDGIRSRELWNGVADVVPADGARVLDFGGGTGSLLAAFVDAGCSCALIDHGPETVAGVEHLGKSVTALPQGRMFDLILASHVIEHVVDPIGTIRDLAERLDERGVLYVEVPHELSGGPPHRSEPLTHINFFAEPSLQALLERCGLDVVRCWTEAMTHANGGYSLAVRSVARRAASSSVDPAVGAGGADHVRALVSMGPAGYAGVLARHPRLLVSRVRRLALRLLCA